jgi:hypothetical protein
MPLGDPLAIPEAHLRNLLCSFHLRASRIRAYYRRHWPKEKGQNGRSGNFYLRAGPLFA